jgi:bifunctional DNA-binding transcriptional regulator/antitoxin component of YhaV-PrlF toxin-antitoxin module
MATITYTARVQQDGSLALPEEAREQLGLHPGDQVEIRIETTPEAPRNPLLGIIGILKGGPADGAENHDAYLYGKKPT